MAPNTKDKCIPDYVNKELERLATLHENKARFEQARNNTERKKIWSEISDKMRKKFGQEPYFIGKTDDEIRKKLQSRHSDNNRTKVKDTNKEERIVVEELLQENKSDVNKSLQNEFNIKGCRQISVIGSDDKPFITIWDVQRPEAATGSQPQDLKIRMEEIGIHFPLDSLFDTGEIPTDLLAEMSQLSIASDKNDEDPNVPSCSKKPRVENPNPPISSCSKKPRVENSLTRKLCQKLEALEKSNPWIDRALMETNIKVVQAVGFSFNDESGEITPEDTEGLTKWIGIFKEILVEKFVTNPLPGYKTSIISDKSSFGNGGIFYVVENEGEANETILWSYPFLRILTEDKKVDVGQMEVFFKHLLETIPDKEQPKCRYFEFAAPNGILAFPMLQMYTTLNDGKPSIMRQHQPAIGKLNNLFDGCFENANDWFTGYRYSRDDLEKLKELIFGTVLPCCEKKFLPILDLVEEDLD